METTLLSGQKDDVIDKIFIWSTKYMAFKAYKEDGGELTDREKEFMSNFEKNFAALVDDKYAWEEIANGIKERLKACENKYNTDCAESIMKIAGRIKAHPIDYKDYIKKEDFEFVRNCDMLKATSNFFKLANTLNSERKIDDKLISSLTDNFATNLFLGRIGENFNLNTMSKRNTKSNEEQNQNIL